MPISNVVPNYTFLRYMMVLLNKTLIYAMKDVAFLGNSVCLFWKYTYKGDCMIYLEVHVDSMSI